MTSKSLLALTLLLSAAATVAAEREIQIRSIDFQNGLIEVFNFSSASADLTGWRFCSHDFDQARRYTLASGLNGVTVAAGGSLIVHFNNDAPAGVPGRINRSALGSFAEPLAPGAYGLQLFFPNPDTGTVSFANSSLIADHLQWNVGGAATGLATTRSGQAVGEGLWTAVDAFIATSAQSLRLELTDTSGDASGGPAEYAVTDDVDSDSDGVFDTADNCTEVANPDQRDSNGDGFGNLCDGDLNNDCNTNFVDLNAMRAVFFTSDPDANLDGVGTVNFGDLNLLRGLFFRAPGPSGVPNDCDP